jgi:hypothetical protein
VPSGTSVESLDRDLPMNSYTEDLEQREGGSSEEKSTTPTKSIASNIIVASKSPKKQEMEP